MEIYLWVFVPAIIISLLGQIPWKNNPTFVMEAGNWSTFSSIVWAGLSTTVMAYSTNVFTDPEVHLGMMIVGPMVTMMGLFPILLWFKDGKKWRRRMVGAYNK